MHDQPASARMRHFEQIIDQAAKSTSGSLRGVKGFP
jgi:hypothetical protein